MFYYKYIIYGVYIEKVFDIDIDIEKEKVFDIDIDIEKEKVFDIKE